MRVLVMAHAWVPRTGAGAETGCHALMRAVVEAGHQVDVLLSQNRGPAVVYEVDGVTVHPYVDTGDPFRWFGTEHNTPHVVVSQLEAGVRAAVLARMHNIPYVQVLHNDMMHTRHAVREGPPGLIVYNTEWTRKSITEWLLFVAEEIPPYGIVVHPPIRPDEYATTPGDRITQVNLFTGTKAPEVFYELARRFPNKPFLGVIGAYGDQLIQDLPNVELVGPFPPDQMVEQVYSKTKVLLMPSSYESYGRAAVEACCSGIPVIASTAPGLVEALGEGGTCIDRTDLDGWETELRKVLTPRGWSAASKRARKVADGLTTDDDLARFVKELENVARVGP